MRWKLVGCRYSQRCMEHNRSQAHRTHRGTLDFPCKVHGTQYDPAHCLVAISFSYLYALRVPRKGLMQSQSGLLLPSHGRDVARVARAEMRTKQKTPFAAILPLKCFLRGDIRLAEAKAGLMRNMVVDGFLYPWQRETEIFLTCARQCQQGNSPRL